MLNIDNCFTLLNEATVYKQLLLFTFLKSLVSTQSSKIIKRFLFNLALLRFINKNN